MTAEKPSLVRARTSGAMDRAEHRTPLSDRTGRVHGCSVAALLAFTATLLGPPVLAQGSVDLAVIDRIKTEAFDRSEVMEHLYYLTDAYGPRLTGSPEFEQAANWAMERLRGYGVSEVHEERWGPFGRSWSLRQYSLELVEPRYAVMTAVPLAWSASTRGPVTADLLLAPFDVSFARGPKKLEEEFDAYRQKWTGKLHGKVVLLNEANAPSPQTKAAFRRYSETELTDLATAPEPTARLGGRNLEELKWPDNPEELSKFFAALPPSLIDQLFDKYNQLLADRARFFTGEGVAAILLADKRAHLGSVSAEAAGPFKSAELLAPPTFVITAEQYDRLARAVDKKLPVKVRLNLETIVSDNDVDGWNIVGEIPSGASRDEVVMIGAHFDSWHAGTGATDNGAGSAVMIEVMRILQALDLKLHRTVRIALWGGEEQGLLGSRAYVKEHFADAKTMKPKGEHAKLSGYFNLDNGSGKIRGVYLQGNERMRPIFQQWLAPFRDLGVSTITIRRTGGTDHLSFDAVGLPAFQFVQDPLDYSTITHHSDMDTYDHTIAADLMQAAAVITTVVWQAANRPDLLPRRPLPRPEDARPLPKR